MGVYLEFKIYNEEIKTDRYKIDEICQSRLSDSEEIQEMIKILSNAGGRI